MKRTILLTAAVAALTAVMASNNVSAAEPVANDGQISADMLAQFGLGGSEEVSDEEGEEIRGKGGRAGNKKLQVRYRVIVQKLKEGKLSVLKRILDNKHALRLLKLKNGKSTRRYKADIRRPKQTSSGNSSNWRPATSFSGIR